ncbi:MAG: ROK family transcriptional regulator [Rhizobiales bacterium]|nr:ROK family transcriptional regulator [Hyphomicrobiales bacterium]
MDIEIGGPDHPPPAKLGRGTRQTGVRLYNERLVLSLVRHHKALPKADIARLTSLSPPTVSAIVGALEADGLLVRKAPQRGRVGQPSVPVSLNPDGAFSIGVKIGRRRCDMVLMDFVGGIRAERHRTYLYPEPSALLEFIGEASLRLEEAVPAHLRERIAGIGIAVPGELWNWEEEVGSPPGAMQAWKGIDFASDVGRVTDQQVFSCNDATAACAAELLFGEAGRHPEMLYLFVAWFIGGGVVLDGHLFPGRTGYAGSIGQVLVPALDEAGRATGRQLLHVASMYLLERAILAGGGDPSAIWESPDDWSSIESHLGDWIDRAAEGIAHAVVDSFAVIDFEAAVIDGALPASVRKRIVAATRDRIARLETKGLPPIAVVEGSIGNGARAIGAAALPFLAKFMRDRELLFRTPVEMWPALAEQATRTAT